MKFERFIERHYKGLNFISIPTEAHIPGVILNNQDRVETALARLFGNEPQSKWATKFVNAQIPNETITGKRKLGLDFSLLGIISAKGSATAQYTASFEFSEVEAFIFDTSAGAVFENDVREMIMELKEVNEPSWRRILHEFVVMEAIIVKHAVVTFERNGEVVTEATFPTTAGEVSIKGSYGWNAEGKLVIENTFKIPFGVMGFQVKRNM